MPSCITHQLIAEEAESFLPVEAAKAVQAAPDYYEIGAQGPDLFFFYRVFSGKKKNLGRLLHREYAYEFFQAFQELLRGDYFKESAKQKVLAYVCGYISHYCADLEFHPFIYAYLEKYGDGSFLHQKIENDWDVYFLRRKRQREAEYYEFPFSVNKLASDGVLFVLFSFLFSRIQETAFSKSNLHKMLKLFGRYLHFFHGKCYSLQSGWKKAESFFGTKPRLSRVFLAKDPENEFLRGDHFSELSRKRAESADELFDIAVEKSANFTAIFCDCLQTGTPLPKELFNLNFYDGTEET